VLACSSESEASLQERGHCISKKLPPAPLPKIAGTRLAMVAAFQKENLPFHKKGQPGIRRVRSLLVLPLLFLDEGWRPASLVYF